MTTPIEHHPAIAAVGTARVTQLPGFGGALTRFEYGGARPPLANASGATMWVACVTLSELLPPYAFVELVDIDIQGAELKVVAEAIHRLDARVRRVHVATHMTEVEHGLREVFCDHGLSRLDAAYDARVHRQKIAELRTENERLRQDRGAAGPPRG